MDQLSSCYFCGASLDVSLSEYPVVPKQFHPDESEQQTVVLCPTCRRKLATVVESVVAAAESDQSTGTQRVDEDDQSNLMDESGIDAQLDPMDLSDANESDDSELLDGIGDDDARNRPEPDRNEIESTAPSSNDRGEDDGPESETASSNAGNTADAESDANADSDPGLTRLEYNKVMRLLQNREFPVDRRGFREVATSAYDIGNEQFDAIIDAAIERDLIGEEDGQLVSAE